MNIQEKIDLLKEAFKRAQEPTPQKLKLRFKDLTKMEWDAKYKGSDVTPNQMIAQCEKYQEDLKETLAWVESLIAKATGYKTSLGN